MESNLHTTDTVSISSLNATGGEAGLARSIPARFAEIVRAVPSDHLAYVGADGSWTYAELDRQSDRLACALLEVLGPGGVVGEQKAVALLLPHAAASLVGILGVLKTGHFLVPLAPEHGANHHIQVMADCPPAAWVTTTALLTHSQAVLAAADGGGPLPIFLVDDLPACAAAMPPVIEISPQANAILFYTSGTTGKPRGVPQTHVQILVYTLSWCQDMGLTRASRVSYLHSYAFIVALVPIGTLLHGATVCAFALAEGTLAGLYQFLLQEQLTQLSTMTSTLRGLAEVAEGRPPLASIRMVSVGGETVHRQDLANAARMLPAGCRLGPMIGSTESYTYARFIFEIGAAWEGERVPAGYAPPYIEIMILDADRQPLPPGSEGEIAVRGRYLTPGYWNQPELNAAKFLPDPDGGDRRIFLTGDRGRMAPDGLLEHLGRMDFMVKVRGYRVEPETVERTLLAHPNLYEGVVVARPSRDGGSQLVAYLAARQQPAPSVSELRGLLAQTLPPYMIPARFVFMDRLPRNANRKVDRPALPPPGASRLELAIPFVAPRNELEQQLADIWAEFLELDEVGVEDNFFELGGDSLMAMRMVQEVEQQLGLSVSADFFGEPTVAHLARLVDGEAAAADASLADVPVDASLADFSEAPEAAPAPGTARQTRQRGRGQIAATGPLWRGHGLPYGVGVRVQRAWLALPGVPQALFGQKIALLRRCGELVGRPPGPEMIRQSLLANTWSVWRDRVLAAPLGASRWVDVQGDPALWQPRQGGPGVIFLVTHSPLTGLFTNGLTASGIRWFLIRGGFGSNMADTMKQPGFFAQLHEAREVLRRGGVVLIAGDGRLGVRGVTLPFFGGQRLFRQGGAELAVQTGALLVPVFGAMSASGRVQIEVCAPLTAGGGGALVQVEELTRAYGEQVVARWPQLYPHLDWNHLRRVLGDMDGTGPDSGSGQAR